MSDHLRETAAQYRSDLKQELLPYQETKSITICPDIWTEKQNQTSFLGVCIITMDTEFNYRTIEYGCKPYSLSDKTAENIEKAI